MSKELNQLYDLLSELPDYCTKYCAAKSETLSLKTRIAYIGDIKVFLYFLITQKNQDFPYESVKDIPLSSMEKLDNSDIDIFVQYLTEYTFQGKTYQNSPAGKKRKIATLKSFFKYFQRIGRLTTNPAELTEIPKLREKPIVVLSKKEQEQIRKVIETGSRKSEKQKKYHEKTKFRDLAILSLFLGTGIRVSELVSINDFDLDLSEQRVLVTRKGGKQEFVYFNREVLDTLCTYIDYERNALLGLTKEKKDTYEDAPLFLSQRHKRITVRMVEIIIKKYAATILPPNVKATPHTLRKTFGTELYAKYKDLYLVQAALGHSSPATTAKYYAKFDPEYLKQLRED